MRAWRWALGALVVGSLAAACGGPSTPAPTTKGTVASPAVAPPTAAQKPAAPAVMPRIPEPGPALPPLAYEPKGRRDPFVPVQTAKEKEKTGLEVGTVRLVGMISGSQPVALVEGPDGLGYILKPGDVLGNGRVTEVTAHSITFALRGGAGQRETNLTLKLVKD